MKPELKAMLGVLGVDIKDAPGVIGTKQFPRPIEAIINIFLSSLHWREDELWCGPIMFGRLWDMNTNDGCRIGWARAGHAVTFEMSETKARAALEAAARKQINTWFKE